MRKIVAEVNDRMKGQIFAVDVVELVVVVY
jgi:hypothetical protein